MGWGACYGWAWVDRWCGGGGLVVGQWRLLRNLIGGGRRGRQVGFGGTLRVSLLWPRIGCRGLLRIEVFT